MPPGPPAPSRGSALALDDVHLALRRNPVLVGVRWEVPLGTVVALLGLTGAGKSALLELAAGIRKPDRGAVRLMGQDPTVPANRRLLGYMPQTSGLYPELSVEDNMRLFAEGAGLRLGADLDRLLEFLELSRRRHEPVAHLAAGWQRRVSLGVALMSQAPVLLLDDPFAHSDAHFSAKTWAHLRELAALGRTVVVATSQPSMAAQAQRIALLRAGRLVHDGPTEALAPTGRARLLLHYQKKTATRTQEIVSENYRQELVGLVRGGPDRPLESERLTEVEVIPETLENVLTRMLTKEPG